MAPVNNPVRLRLRLGLVIVLMAILLLTLHTMSNLVQNADALNKFYIPLLVVSVGGLVILLGLVTVNLVQLLIAFRQHRPGARLTAKIVSLFASIALIPVLVVFYYSMQFLQQGIDSWFDVEIDMAMSDALSLSKAALTLERSRLLAQTTAMSRQLANADLIELLGRLSELQATSGAAELTLMDENGLVIASRNQDPSMVVADTPGSAILQQARQSGSFVGLTPYGPDALLHIRVVVSDRAVNRALQALYPTTERVSLLSERVETAYESYQQLMYLRDELRFGFTLTLALVLLFAALGAVWAAFYIARKMLMPLVDLSEATRQVADGDYNTRLPDTARQDELGFLAASFNVMTQRIGLARDAAARSQREVEAQRSYLQTLLEHLATGVITFDQEGRILTINSAASRILQMPIDNDGQQTLDRLAKEEPSLQLFFAQVRDAVFEKEQKISIDTANGRRTLRWRITPLIDERGQSRATVLMFDDVTDLLKAQRDAAWGEVARRLAHEIKNPLTPIQLSAERLRRKYLPLLEQEQGEVLDRATHTIVQQVEAMKQMVNAFSDYAKPSSLDKDASPVIFDTLLRDVLSLYSSTAKYKVVAELQAADARLRADPIKLRQLIHNLMKNAIEAVEAREQGQVHISSTLAQEQQYRFVELVVSDNGSGFDGAMIDTVFDPYVTTKAGGTGLGLAIVRKIVEEHGGGIWLLAKQEQGAKVVVRLPLWRDDGSCDVIPAPAGVLAGSSMQHTLTHRQPT